MATLAPEVDLAAALVAATPTPFSPALVLGTDIKYGPPRAPLSPGNAAKIWIMPYGGPEPEPLLNASVEGSLYESSVQVLVRSGADDFAGGLVLARQVRDVLHLKQSASYIAWTAKSAEPLYLGPDEAGQHRFTVNVRAQWKGIA